MDQPPAYSPQNISDILPIYRPQDADGHIRIYKLRQSSPNLQSLTLQDDQTAASYAIRTRATGGFMNRKPHVIISNSDESNIIAKGRFESLGTGTTVTYLPNLRMQSLNLENSQMQLLKTTISGVNHWWQPHPGNRGVLELTNEMEEIVARFIYAAPTFQARSSSSVTSMTKALVEEEMGELSVVEELSGGTTGLEEILCSAVVVIERSKRRAANMSKVGGGSKSGTGFASPVVTGGFS